MVRFSELDPASFGGAILIVDVDGTITNDNSEEVEWPAKLHLRKMTEYARVYLCSNSASTARFWHLARDTGATYLVTPLRKPDVRILQLIPHTAGKRIVVIGDKKLTDGRFADRIGAEFVQTARITHDSDRWSVRLTYALDDLYSWLSGMAQRVAPFIELARPLQWVKNLLVFSPMFFASKVFDATIFTESLIAFLVFSFSASAVYVMNDLVDAPFDRLHPNKKHRPIARNAVHETKAVALVAVFLAMIIISLAFSPAVLPIALLYIGLNVLYSFKLKHVAVVDVLLVASFYLLRVVAGGLATALPLSPWIILCVLFGALFIIVGKRKAEFSRESRRTVLESYSPAALDALLAVSAGLSIISYGLYSILGHNSPYLVYSTIFVVFAFFRVLNDIFTHPNDAESPEKLVFKDRWIFGAFLCWVLYVFVVFYIL